MTSIQKRISEELCGKKLFDFRFVEGGTLILFFGIANFEDEGRQRLWVDCAWRLEIDGLIIAGSLDDSENVLTSLQKLVGETVNSITIASVSGDLKLRFSNGGLLESFGYSTDLELWEYRRTDGLRIGIGPHFCAFERNEEPDS